MSDWKIYKIPKGRHYCSAFWKRLEITCKKENVFEFELTADNWYDPKLVHRPGKSKVIGRTYGYGVHKNSIRIVYKADKEINKFHLWWYWYDNGVRKHKYIGKFGVGVYQARTVKIGKRLICWFRDKRIPKHMMLEYTKLVIDFEKELPNWGFYCFAFFGGWDKAYKDFYWKLKYC